MGARRADSAHRMSDPAGMANAKCQHCDLIAFSSAQWSTIDHCPACGMALSHQSATVTPIWSHPRFRAHAGDAETTLDGPSAA
jgi:hypothetical protein